MSENATIKSPRDKFVQRQSINADPFSVDQTTKTVVLDLHPFVNNKAIQVNSLTGTLTMQLSCDGQNWSNSSTPSSGITPITTPCRYVQLTIDTSVGHTASGLLFGSLR